MDSIRNLKYQQGNVNLEATIMELEETQTLQSRTSNDVLLKRSALITDNKNPRPEDFITLTLWEENTTKVALGDRIRLTNAYVGKFNDQLYLTLGNYGKLEVIT
jgi:hypothetical protein